MLYGLALGTAGLVGLDRLVSLDSVRHALPGPLFRLVYTAFLFRDWGGHPVTLVSVLRTGALWGISFTAGFAVGFFVGALTHISIDGVVWAIEKAWPPANDPNNPPWITRQCV